MPHAQPPTVTTATYDDPAAWDAVLDMTPVEIDQPDDVVTLEFLRGTGRPLLSLQITVAPARTQRAWRTDGTDGG